MFNEFASAAIQSVDDIHTRACYELFTDVILVTNAIKNSLQANPSGKQAIKKRKATGILLCLYFIKLDLISFQKVNQATDQWEFQLP